MSLVGRRQRDSVQSLAVSMRYYQDVQSLIDEDQVRQGVSVTWGNTW